MSTDKSHPQDSPRAILQSTSIISLGTFVSRILGFVRDILLAKFLGTGFAADAFFVAFRIPNVFREMLAEGAANSAVVPVLSEYTHKASPDAYRRFVNILFVVAGLILILITIGGIILAPVIVRIMAPGFIQTPEKLQLAVNLTRILFPYLILIGLTAYSIAVHYSLRSFVSAAFGPCLLNVAFIASILICANRPNAVYGLAFGVLLGGLLQLAVQQITLANRGIHFSWPRTFGDPGLAKVGRLLIPRLFGSSIYQLSILVNTLCASLAVWVGEGGISAIYYSDRIIQFPNGVFIAALASVVLPTMSGQATKRDTLAFRGTITFALKNVFFVMLPTMVLFLSLAYPIIEILFKRGQFDEYSARITAQALTFYALGLVSIGGVKILVTAFHALQNTLTPVKIAGFCLVLNTVLNFILMIPLKIGGIALASAISVTVNFILLFLRLHRRLPVWDRILVQYIGKVVAASLVMALAISLFWARMETEMNWLRLAITVIVGYAAFGLAGFLLRIEQIIAVAEKISAWSKKA